MFDPQKVEKSFDRFIKNLPILLPEGVNEVNLELLTNLDLLDFQGTKNGIETLSRYFHVQETPEKITLIDDEFIVWIVPSGKVESTYVLIALNQESMPKLEAAFRTTGVYNTTPTILQVLERYLNDIHENERLINRYKDI